MWLRDVETFEFIEVNNTIVLRYGYGTEEFCSTTLYHLLTEGNNDFPDPNKRRQLNKTAVLRLKKTNEFICVNLDHNLVTIAGRNAWLVLSADINKEFSYESILSERKKRIKALPNKSVFTVLDGLGNFKIISPIIQHIIDPENTVIGKNVLHFIYKKDKERFSQQFKLLSIHKSIKISAFRFKIGKNRYRWIETVFTDMTDDPAVGGILASSIDITQRIKIKNNIKEIIKHLNITSTATNAIWDWDILNNKLLWNNGIKVIFGYKQLSFTYRWRCDRIHPDDVNKVTDDMQSFLKNKKSNIQFKYRFRCADGTYRYVQDKAFLIFNSGGSPIRMIGVVQDISAHVKFDQIIENQNKKFKEISWIQSHVVRAPLARILALTNLLADFKTKNVAIKALLGYLKNSAEELDAVIMDIARKAESSDLSGKEL